MPLSEDELIALTAKELGPEWSVAPDGFLIHPLTDEEEAQRIWNEKYAEVLNRK